MRKPFADVVPEDFNDYIDDRCQSVEAPTVDREIDLFSAVCRMAIDTWRIPVAKNPMDGIRRPRYFNERDRRLKGDEETRLLTAAFNEDAQRSIEARLEELMAAERAQSETAATTYRRKALIKAARSEYLGRAEATRCADSAKQRRPGGDSLPGVNYPELSASTILSGAAGR